MSNVEAAGVIFLSINTGRVLLQFRNSDKKQKHTWGFWGGVIENNETPIECIHRELREELGFLPDISKINPIDIFQSRDKHFMYYSFVAVIDEEFIPELNDESCGYAWVNIGVWPQPLHAGARATLGRNKGKEKLKIILDLHKPNNVANKL